MNIYKPLLKLFLFGILSASCNDRTEKSEADTIHTDSLNSEPIIFNSENSIDYFSRAHVFAFKTLGIKIRIHEFTNGKKSPSYLKLFPEEELTKVIAFSNKDYPKNSEPTEYEHFTLFCLEYKSKLNAEYAFRELKYIATYDLKALNNFDSLTTEKVKFMIAKSKPGGFILQKGNWLFSLVETCRETPTGGTWEEYENLFVSYIADNTNDTITVLDSDCGKMKYVVRQIIPKQTNGR